MKPRLLDPSFVYVPAVKTDIRKTFARVRREQAAAEQARERAGIAEPKVTPLKQRGAK